MVTPMFLSETNGLPGLPDGSTLPGDPTLSGGEPVPATEGPSEPGVPTVTDGGGDTGIASPGDTAASEPAATETGSVEIEGETEATPWISQPVHYLPALGGYSITNGMVLAALGVVLALLAALLVRVWKKKTAKAKAAPPPDPPRQTAPVEAPAPPPPAPEAPQHIRAAYHQHIGTREDQQDSFTYSDPTLYPQRGVLAVVADGMGGLSNGKAVSSALVRVFDEGFRQADPQRNSADLLLELAVRANAQVNRMLQGQERSGSTLVAAIIKNGYLNFLTVGDSRIYLYRGGSLIQLNREHIFQEELAVKALNRAVSLNQVRKDRQAHSLTSYFGIGRIPTLDRNDEGIKLIDGDKILLATDGVFGTLTAAQLESALRQSVNDASTTIGDMIRAADRPHQDNNTAVILEYHR